MKQKITFDQLFQSVIYRKINEKGLDDTKIKYILDATEFNEEDMIDDYNIVMIKSYGGTRYSIPDIDATPMSLQILVNTDSPQSWKRILTEIIDDINGKWNEIGWEEDDTYLGINYHYMPTLNLPIVLGGASQVGTSTRYTITLSGTVYYTTNGNLAPTFKIELYDEDDDKYTDLNYLITATFGYTNQTEAFQNLEKIGLENETRGTARYLSASYIFDKDNAVHNKIMSSFFKGETNTLKIRTYIDDALDTNLSTVLNVIIAEYTVNYILGNSISVQIKLMESSD